MKTTTIPRIISQPNVNNRSLYIHDNLPVLRSMDSETVDLIYLDPPFNTGREWANPIEANGQKAIASFKDTWRMDDIHMDEYYALAIDYPDAAHIIDALRKVNGDSWAAYLIYMGVRLAQLHRILKDTGSIYFHCDPVMSHGVKLLMDSIFEKKNFHNEIIWHYAGTGRRKIGFPRKHDTIFLYSKSDKATFNPPSVSAKKVSGWTGKDTKLCDSVWADIGTVFNSSERKGRTGYPTQKPLALLERIIEASSNKGDTVLDPFCGCATTCIAAEKLGRNWIGIDLSEKAADIIYKRLHDTVDSPLADPEAEVNKVVVNNQHDLPKRTDLPKYDRRATRARLLKLYGKKCACCQEEFQNDRILESDHIIAKSRGGQDIDENIQLLCGPCNQDKGGGSMEAARRKMQERLMKEKMEAAREDWWNERKIGL